MIMQQLARTANYTQVVTPETAEYLLQHQCTARQRDVKRSKVTKICNAMLDGTFIATTPIVIAIYPNNERKLADGQHRLQAIINLQTSCMLDVHEYNVKNDDEFGKLISSMDQGTKRTQSDQVKSMGVHEELKLAHGLTKKQITNLLTAVSPIYHNFNKSAQVVMSINMPAGIKLMHTYAPFYPTYLNHIKNAKTNRKHTKFVSNLETANVLPVALKTIEALPAAAREFWSQIAGEAPTTNRYNSEAADLAVDWIMNYKDALAGRDAGGIGQRLEMNIAVILCWNAFIKNKSIKKRNITDTIKTGTVPVLVLS